MKRLYKSRKDKVIDGICAGVAEYFEIDPVLVRVVFVLFFIFGGIGLIAYIVGMIIIPRRPLGEESAASQAETAGTPAPEPPPSPTPAPPPPAPEPVSDSSNKGSLVIGIVLVVLGMIFLLDNLPFFRGFHFWGWFRHRFWDFVVPGIFIAVGIVLLMKSREEKE
ncbi:MAG: PspC domain-containing protein [bacterium]|nr:PspC domain-containing protein [bacterium]